MDTTIIFTLVLSALFLGGIAWLVIYSRRRQRVPVRAQRPPMTAGRKERRAKKGVG